MSARSFPHLIRPAKAIFAVALCAVLAAGAFAATGSRDKLFGSASGSERDARHGFGVAGALGSLFDRAAGRSGTFGGTVLGGPPHSFHSDSGRTDRFHPGSRPIVGRPSDNINGQARSARSVFGPSTIVTRVTESTSITRQVDGRIDRDPQEFRCREIAGRDLPGLRDRGRADWSESDRRIREIERAHESERDRAISCYRPIWYVAPVRRDGFYHYPTRPHCRPLRYAHWVFCGYDPSFCRKSIYFFYGCLPYVEVVRVHVGPYVTVSYVGMPIVIRDGYYLTRSMTSQLDDTLSDIRNAWLNGRCDLIAKHVRSDCRIAVFLDGRYDYSIDPDDYIEMTADALGEIDTVGFAWESVKRRVDGAYTAFGRHVYRDTGGITKTVYVSYTLRRIGSEYYIEEVGSSLSKEFAQLETLSRLPTSVILRAIAILGTPSPS